MNGLHRLGAAASFLQILLVDAEMRQDVLNTDRDFGRRWHVSVDGEIMASKLAEDFDIVVAVLHMFYFCHRWVKVFTSGS